MKNWIRLRINESLSKFTNHLISWIRWPGRIPQKLQSSVEFYKKAALILSLRQEFLQFRKIGYYILAEKFSIYQKIINHRTCNPPPFSSLKYEIHIGTFSNPKGSSGKNFFWMNKHLFKNDFIVSKVNIALHFIGSNLTIW